MSGSAGNQTSDHVGFDIEAREAQVLGKPQRIEPLKPEEWDAEARALIIAIRESVGVMDHSVIPEIIGLMVKTPGLYRSQMDLGFQFLSKGALSIRERELAILRVGWLCRAPFEWGQHVGVSKRYGFTTEETTRVTQGSSAPGWSEHEAAILRGVEELLGDQMISDQTWSVLARSWSEQQLLEFPQLVGNYVSIAYFQNSLRIRLEPGKGGLRSR